MASSPERTRYPGIYKRGSRYPYIFRDAQGRQRWGSGRTLDEARRLKAEAERRARRGGAGPSGVTVAVYLTEWVERYQGTGRRTLRPESRAEYRRHIEQTLIPFFGDRLLLEQVSPRLVSDLVAELARRTGPKGRPLADSTIRNTLKPLRAALRTARQEGLIEVNPAQDVPLPARDEPEGDQAKALTAEQLIAFLWGVPGDRERLILAFAAATGLRRSEILGLDVEHVRLEAPAVVRVRQRWLRGALGPVKSGYGRRDVPLGDELADIILAYRLAEWGGGSLPPSFPFWASRLGTRLSGDNVYARHIVPAREAAGVPWVGWHSMRHTCASRLFAEGRNIVQVQRWLGHHKPSFTLDTYVHLLGDSLGPALEL